MRDQMSNLIFMKISLKIEKKSKYIKNKYCSPKHIIV